MELRESVSVPTSRQRVWEMLEDVHTVVSCLPGAEISPGDSSTDTEGVYNGLLTVQFGPKVLTFRGRAVYARDDQTLSAAIEAQGQERVSRTRAKAVVALTVEASDSGSIIDIRCDMTIGGPLASVIEAGGAQVGQRLVADFRANLVKMIDQNVQEAQEGVPAARSGADIAPLATAGPSHFQLRSLIAGTLRTLLKQLRTLLKQRSGHRSRSGKNGAGESG